jgi:hypothetical protein
VHPLAQVVNFFADIVALAVQRLQLSQLLLNLLQLERRGRIVSIPVACCTPGFHHREQELSACQHCANVRGLHAVYFRRSDLNNRVIGRSGHLAI